MVLLLGIVSCALAVCLVLCPFLFGFGTISLACSLAVGVCVAVLSLVMVKKRQSKALAWCNIVLGVAAFVAGIVTLIMEGHGAYLIICGLLIAVVNVVALPFMISAAEARFSNKQGSDLARVKSVKMKNGETVLAKVVLLGSMPETIYVQPEELIKMLALMDDSVVKGLFGYLLKGYRANKASAQSDK